MGTAVTNKNWEYHFLGFPIFDTHYVAADSRGGKTVSRKTKRFDALHAWMKRNNVARQADLVDRLNAVPGRIGKPRTKSEIGRLLNGQIRFVDPWLGSELAYVTNNEIDGLALLAFAAHCVALRSTQDAVAT